MDRDVAVNVGLLLSLWYGDEGNVAEGLGSGRVGGSCDLGSLAEDVRGTAGASASG